MSLRWEDMPATYAARSIARAGVVAAWLAIGFEPRLGVVTMATEPLPIPDFAVSLASRMDGARPRFSICTLATRPSEYAEMVDSFVSHGFTPGDCEYLYLDNSESNSFDAFRGYNLFLSEARGDFIVLCHQDIRLFEDGRAQLEHRLSELTAHDPEWALCGNAGGVAFTRFAKRISDPYGRTSLSVPSRRASRPLTRISSSSAAKPTWICRTSFRAFTSTVLICVSSRISSDAAPGPLTFTCVTRVAA